MPEEIIYKIRQKVKQKNVYLLNIGLLVESFFAEKSLFQLSNMDIEKWMIYFGAKIIIVLLGTFFYKGFKYLIEQRNNSKVKVYLISFVVILSIYIVYLLFCCPGLWMGDNNVIFIKAVRLELYPVQSIVTELIYIVVLMLIPHPVAVVFAQLLLGALIGAYVIMFLYDRMGSKKVYWLILLFVSVPAVYFLLYTMRGGPFAYCILLLEVMFIELMTSRKIESKKKLYMMSVLVGVISAWRGEAIVILGVFVCALVFCGRKKMCKKMLILSLICAMTVFGLIKGVEEYAWSQEDENAKEVYSLTPFVTGLSRIITSPEIKSTNLAQDLYNVDQIISLDDLVNHASDLAPFNWEATVGIRNDFTKEEYNLGVKSILNLIIRNFSSYVSSKTQMLIRSTGFSTQEGFLYSGFTEESTYNLLADFGAEEYLNLFKPLNNELREAIYKRMIGYYALLPATRDIYYLIWQLWIPILILFLTTLLFLIKRRWFLFWGNMFAIAEFIMTFLLCTGEGAYYYITFYLCGWVSIIILLLYNDTVYNDTGEDYDEKHIAK